MIVYKTWHMHGTCMGRKRHRGVCMRACVTIWNAAETKKGAT